jgi:copper(I)-binding protein
MNHRGRMRAVLLALCVGAAAIGSTPVLAADAETDAEEALTPEEEAAAAAIAEARANINVTGGWTRATPGNATNAAVYLRIANIGMVPERLIGVRAEMSDGVGIHGANMQAMDAMEVPAGDALTFAPNGNHIMLEELRAPLREGDSFLMQLEFEKGGSQTASIQVLSASAMGPPTVGAAASADITSGATEE